MNPHKSDARASQVVIVGGGIAGLSAAWYLQQEAARRGLPVQYTVLESSDRWGGKIRTEQVDGFGDSPFILEGGPDAFLTRKPWAMALARELGLDGRILAINQEMSRTFVLSHGKPIPLPDGVQLLAPTRWLPFLRSPLFSWWGKIRVSFDLLIPPRASSDDETLADFVRRRLGAEALDKLAEPMLAGVFNAEPERQSILATFPQFPALEKTHGSLIRGLRVAARERRPDGSPPFISFQTGTHELVRALVAQLKGDLRLDSPPRRIEPDGSGWRVTLDGGESLAADAIILATPANVAAELLRPVAPQASAELASIRYASIGIIYLAFRRDDVPHPLNGFGVVIPSSERRRIDGMTWTSSKWDCRAPANYALLRVFFGGPYTRQMMSLDDSDLLSAVRDELQAILGIQAEPLFHRIYRWPDAYPQYDVGHLERVAAIEAALPSNLTVTGSAYRGVGVPDCVRQGETAAKRTIEALAAAPS